MSRYSSSKNATLLKDNSWIRRAEDEDEDVDRDPNFGKSVLSRYRSSESLGSPEAEGPKPTKTINTSTSVHALTKRFSGSQDELRSRTLPSDKTTTSYTKRTYSSVKSDYPSTTRTSKTAVREEPKTSTTTTTVTKDGTTTETTITTTQSAGSPVIKTPTKTETFTQRVKASSKEPQYTTYSPTRTTRVTETTVNGNKDAEDKLYDKLILSSNGGHVSPTDSKTTVTTTETVIIKSSTDTTPEDHLYDTLIPTSIKDDLNDSKTTGSSSETVTVRSSTNGDNIKTTTTTRTSSTAEDELYDTLLPRSITSNLSSPVSSGVTRRETVTVESSKGGESPTLTSPSFTRRLSSYSSYTDDSPTTRTTSYTISTIPSDDHSSDYKTYSYSRPDSSSVTSPTAYSSSSYRSSSRSDDVFGDSIYSKSSRRSVYASPERTVLEKDLCTSCRKPFTADAKMVLDDMKINCHASCFKCQVCNGSLGHLKAGDSMWIYRSMVHCENCFEITREKWRH